MSLLYNTGDWFALAPGVTYRKIELYQLDWPEMSLDQMIVAAAPFGGPVAIVRDWQQIVKVTGASKPIIRIFTCSGDVISTLNWNSGTLLTLGWADTEELLCIQDDGLVLIYDMFAKYQHTFSLGQEVKDSKVIDARIFATSAGTGIAVMTTNFRIFCINSYKEPRCKLMPDIPKSVLDVSTWDVFCEERNVFCLVVRGKEIFRLQLGESFCVPQSIQMQADFTKIVRIGISFDHRHVAFYTDTGRLWLGAADLREKYCEFDTGRTEMPRQIEWCLDDASPNGADAVLVNYSSYLLVVGLSGESNVYTYDSAISLIPEMDGVRVLSNSTHDLIQRVPKCVSNIFGISISEPSSFLFEAHRKFLERSHQSNEYLCLIQDNLEMAVDECINAAGHEFDHETQKSLFRAACFGKGFIAGHNPEFYVKMSRIIRVLNNVRDPPIGIPLTLKQFNHMKAKVLIDRLVFRKHYGLAIEIAKYLQLPESRILEHWAFHQVIYGRNDEEIARCIADKFRDPSVQGVSFCNIARKAQEVGKTQLAVRLLELEPRQNLRVPLLLKLGENKKALLAATQSGDTDLVYTVLLQLKETSQLADFQMTIRAFPLAQNLYKKYCQVHSVSALKDIFTQEDDFLSQAEWSLREGVDGPSLETQLPVAVAAYKRARKDVEAELCDETRRLIKFQKQLGERYTRSYLGLSAHDTIRQLLVLGDLKSAEKLRNDFKIPERRFYWLRVQVLAEQCLWDELERLSRSKKSPIGYEPFVEACLKALNISEARKYLPKCRDERRAKMYIRAGLYEEAAAVAFEQKDLQTVLQVHQELTTPPASGANRANVIAKVENMIAQLSDKK